MVRRRILIYGSTGYTGRLIAEHARKLRRSPIVAGRSADRVQALAARLGVSGRVVALDEPDALDQALGDVGVVINAASPFAHSAPALIEACLRTRTHYLDITGELPVFRDAFGYDAAARKRGIMIMPGVGLGVVASDCLAMHVAARVPNAKYLRIALLRPDSILARQLSLCARLEQFAGDDPSKRAADFGAGRPPAAGLRLWRRCAGKRCRELGRCLHRLLFNRHSQYRDLFRGRFHLANALSGRRRHRRYRAAAADFSAGSTSSPSSWPEGPSARRRRTEKCVVRGRGGG